MSTEARIGGDMSFSGSCFEQCGELSRCRGIEKILIRLFTGQ